MLHLINFSYNVIIYLRVDSKAKICINLMSSIIFIIVKFIQNLLLLKIDNEYK